MKDEKIQTLHPVPGKVNKSIPVSKYNFISTHILNILKESTFTHTELMEALYAAVKNEFEGGVQWYGEVVKLDLEARGKIERIKLKPEKYRLVKK